ncbi:hypothetical protein [Nocardia bhagyanarayanae]|uniref:hypothetical protein n=1 Tax=Nocardia bhagyanarayanae TaxID=1215925 RepID=UPI00163B2531|nr:hypothetical protein [Nocardia bhagyanarayanae]
MGNRLDSGAQVVEVELPVQVVDLVCDQARNAALEFGYPDVAVDRPPESAGRG